MQDIDYGAVFGISDGQPLGCTMQAGEKETEAAEPFDDTQRAQGEKEQEAAEPAGENRILEEGGNLETEVEAETEAEAEANQGGEAVKPEGTDKSQNTIQDMDENARFAAARRKAEAQRDAAIEQARREAQEEAQRMIDEAFSKSGMQNPYTQKPITSKEEYEAYKKQYEAERKAEIMQKSGMSQQEFEAFVEGLPQVQKVREESLAAQKAAREALLEKAKLSVEQQMKEISQIDPSVKEISDLTKMDTYPKFYELVQKGNSFIDAYRLANFEALTQKAAAASSQAARNAMGTKQHLMQTTARTEQATQVPQDVAEAYRAFNPDATDAQIQKHYSRYLKK